MIQSILTQSYERIIIEKYVWVSSLYNLYTYTRMSFIFQTSGFKLFKEIPTFNQVM